MSRLSPSQVQTELSRAQDAYRRGDAATAIRQIDLILRSNPDSVGAYLGKGMVLVQQGRHSDALNEFLQALKYDGANVEALTWAAMACLNLRRSEEAESLARRLTETQPYNDRAHFLLANALCLQDRLDEALIPIDRALAIRPLEADYVVAKAQILGRLTWASQAIGWYRRALEMRKTPHLAFELAASLIQEGQVQESLSILERYAPLVPPEARPYTLMGQAYTEAQQFDSAEEHWASASRYTTDPSELALTRANAEICAGRLSVAEALLREALEHEPSAVKLYMPLAAINKITVADTPLVESMERAAASGELAARARQDLEYALGKVYHDLGDFEKAMVHYDQANRLAYEASTIAKKFDPVEWAAYTDFLIRFFTKERIGSLVNEGLATGTPLFIVGMIRSGTTLTEQILSRHPKIRDGGEKTFWPDHRSKILDPKSGSFDVAAAKRLGAEFLGILQSSGANAQYVTEKNPSNVMLSALLHCVYPNAKFVHIKRYPVDNLLSIWMTPIQTGLPFVHNRENLVLAFRDYLRLVDHLVEVLPENRFQTFTYEDITSDPVPTIENMLSFLDLESDQNCFSPENNPRTVRTPSFYQVRQPINTASQARWKQYQPWLGPFAELLE